MSRDRLHPSTSKIDDQLLQEKQTIVAAPKPHFKDYKLEDGEQPSNCVESSKPSLHDEKLEKECQPPKDVENDKCLLSKNLPKENKKFDENYGKASGVPYWVNTRCVMRMIYEKDQELAI